MICAQTEALLRKVGAVIPPGNWAASSPATARTGSPSCSGTRRPRAPRSWPLRCPARRPQAAPSPTGCLWNTTHHLRSGGRAGRRPGVSGGPDEDLRNCQALVVGDPAARQAEDRDHAQSLALVRARCESIRRSVRGVQCAGRLLGGTEPAIWCVGEPVRVSEIAGLVQRNLAGDPPLTRTGWGNCSSVLDYCLTQMIFRTVAACGSGLAGRS